MRSLDERFTLTLRQDMNGTDLLASLRGALSGLVVALLAGCSAVGVNDPLVSSGAASVRFGPRRSVHSERT